MPIGELKTLETKVEVNPSQVTSLSLPAEIDGVTINVVEAEPIAATECFNQRKFSSIPGGVVNGDGPGDGGAGTSCVRAKKNGEYRMLTAAHLFYRRGNCGAGLVGRRAFQRGQKVGQIRDGYNRHDWVAYNRNNSDLRLTDQIKKYGGRVGISGYMNSRGLAYWGGDGQPFYKVGISTGQTKNNSEPITIHSNAEYWDECVNMDGSGVIFANNQAAGDSGGPVFVQRNSDGKWFVVSLNTFRAGGRIGTACNNPLYGRGGGWPAYKLANNADYRFGV